MSWPSPQDYSEAVQNARTAFYDIELQQGTPELNKLGLPRPRSGSFATVYKILSGTPNWAVRCFLNPVSDQQERYAAISSHLAKIHLPYLVQFSFLPQGIRVANQTYPILKMEWVEGEPLDSYIGRNLGNARVLLGLAGRWVEMMKAMRQASIAHGDLQHGNVLVLNSELKLVDYDGMFVPSLAGKISHEVGQRNYQHPLRGEFDYGPNLDNFSSWVIYISLIALSVQPQLWQQFRGGDDCLIFRRGDFESPERAPIFRSLENLYDDKLRSAVALFRSLLDLGPQDVPALDGQVLPSISLVPKTSTAGNWISDYVKQPSETNAERDKITLESDPTPSWIQDFIASPTLETHLRMFENSVVQERIGLAISLCLISLIAIGVYLKAFPLMELAWGGLAIIASNYVFWLYRFRLEPAVSEVSGVNLEMKAIGDKIDVARTIVKSRQADKKSLSERYSFDQNKASRDLETVRSDEKREIEGVQAAFALERDSVSLRRRALNQQEANDLQNISNSLGSQVVSLNNRIASLVQAEASELAAALGAQQNHYVGSYLQNWPIDAAGIPGIGPGFKTRLRMAGVLTAADVDHRIYGVKGFGAVRSSALTAWHQALKARAQKQMPKMLSPAQTDSIKRKYAGQGQLLHTQKVLIEQQVGDAEVSVRARYKSLREPLEKEELAATAKTQSKLEIIRNKYKERYQSLESIRRRLDEDFRRTTVEIDEKSNKERRNLFALHWEQEKIRRRLNMFSRIALAIYIKRVFGAR
jgi:hypothetical protein